MARQEYVIALRLRLSRLVVASALCYDEGQYSGGGAAMRWTRGRVWVVGLTAALGALAVGVFVSERRLGIAPSTRRMWRAARAAGQPWWLFAHTYTYGRWSYAYIATAIGERGVLARAKRQLAPLALRLSTGVHWADEYHGKVMPTPSARRIVEVHEDVAEVVPEQVLPFHSARNLVLAADGPLVAFDCPCRSAREHPCLPMDVCLVVGEPFATFVLEHHPGHARRIDRQEAVAILEGEADRGHVHHAFFKHAMLDRLYAICNCCSCCCGAMWAQRNGTPMLVSSGYVARVEPERCVGCGLCAERCPFEAVTAASVAEVDAARCMGCGVCVHACPNDALQLVRDATKPAPLEIRAYVAGADALRPMGQTVQPVE